MLNLKLLFKCCCENPYQEEEKLPKSSQNSAVNKIMNKSQTANQTFVLDPKFQEETSIMAAPSPAIERSSKSSPNLILKIIESISVPIGTTLKITSMGMEDSKRGKSDNKTYIGSAQKGPDGEVINDFIVEEESQGMGRQHLLITYQPSRAKYMISDLGDGTGTFLKISHEFILREGFIISFGNSHMKIMDAGNTSNDQKLVIKFLEGPKANEEYGFHPSDEIILIGRMADCRIRFGDSNLSRYQCNIIYSHHTKAWIIKDGVGEKKSTNGTWLYVEEEFEIYDKLIFKAGKTLFEAHIE
jgi:pSer/pThr/pTyr-binding forkhead associated (FHA) protein